MLPKFNYNPNDFPSLINKITICATGSGERSVFITDAGSCFNPDVYTNNKGEDKMSSEGLVKELVELTEVTARKEDEENKISGNFSNSSIQYK
uniref:Uncharacterized protein n=1 Tax=Megaselia scalaris TaxID=36166 RepID=T1GZC2_MEGSC